MPQATGRDIHVDVPLTNVAIAYRPEGMIADLIAPIVSVPKQSGTYWEFLAADAFRTQQDLRSPGALPNLLTKDISSGTFFAKNYALRDVIPYEDIENADAGTVITARNMRAEAIKDKLMLNAELRVANQVTSGSNVGSYSATASSWAGAGADPVADVNTGINNVHDLTGIRPNSIVMGNYAWRLFREHSTVIGRVFGDVDKGQSARMVSRQQAAALFEMERFLVGGGYINTADEGLTMSLSQIWNDNCLAYYAPMQPRIDKPSFMYAMRWAKVMAMQAEVHQLPRQKGEEIHLGYYQDEKLTGASLGFLITGVGSSQ